VWVHCSCQDMPVTDKSTPYCIWRCGVEILYELSQPGWVMGSSRTQWWKLEGLCLDTACNSSSLHPHPVLVARLEKWIQISSQSHTATCSNIGIKGEITQWFLNSLTVHDMRIKSVFTPTLHQKIFRIFGLFNKNVQDVDS